MCSAKGGLTIVELLADIASGNIGKYQGMDFNCSDGNVTGVSYNGQYYSMSMSISAGDFGGGSAGGPTGFASGIGTLFNPIQLPEIVVTPSSADEPGINNVVGIAISTGEILIGIAAAPASGGTSTYLIIDGIFGVGANLADLLSDKDLPNNMGGLIGQGINGQNGAMWGQLLNSGVTAIMSGGAFQSFWAASAALNQNNYGWAAYYSVDGYNTAVQAGTIYQDGPPPANP